jgi:hypothetical protein
MVIRNFVGTWKQDPAKTKRGSLGSLRFGRAADGSLEELRGPEARPIVHPVKFGIPAYKVPGSRYMIAWKQIDSEHFERQMFENGKVISTRKITLSDDGRSATEVLQRQTADRKHSTVTLTYLKTSGDPQGLVGIWKLESLDLSEPLQLRITAIDSDGLRLIGTFGGTGITTWMFDGKPNAVSGHGVVTGTMSSVRLLRDNAVEQTEIREGTITGTTVWEVSDDGKTLTATIRETNGTEDPLVLVYEKQAP